jgi:hypothetical protein
VRHSLRISHRGYVLENGSIVIEGNGAELLQDDRVRRAYLGLWEFGSGGLWLEHSCQADPLRSAWSLVTLGRLLTGDT